MRVDLIYPYEVNRLDRYDGNSRLTSVGRKLFGLGNSNHTPPLSLLMLASVTPPDVELHIVDERLDRINYDDPVDLVGITVITRSAFHAYEIASEYRRRGVRVVLGGIHPTALPEEASQYADTVVLGEGEQIWPVILSDYKKGRLGRIYQDATKVDFERLARPRRDVLSHPARYFTTGVVTTSRGCPNACSFCSAQLAVGKERRARRIENVIAEVEQFKNEVVIFADDNIAWDVNYAKRLFRALIPLNITWVGDSSLSAFEDLEFVELAAKSGCAAISIGFESVSPASIVGIRKHRTNNPSRYWELTRRIHDHGIAIKGNFILGFDEDTPRIFSSLVEFIELTRIEMPSVNTLVPFPGTPIFHQFEGEGRLLHKNWRSYDNYGAVVYTPKMMSRQQLIDGYLWVMKSVFSITATMNRVLGAGTALSGPGTLGSLHFNLKQRANARQYETGLDRSQD